MIQRKSLTALTVILLIFFYSLLMAQFPFGYGFDYWNYLEIFRKAEESSDIFSTISELRYEPIPLIIIYIFSSFNNQILNYFAIFIFTSAIMKFASGKMVGASIMILALVYILKYAPLYDVNQFRAGLGLSFCYLAIAFLIQRNDFGFIAFSILAFFTHYSVIFPLFIFSLSWLTKIKSQWRNLFLFTIAICLYFYSDKLIDGFQNAILSYQERFSFNEKTKLISPMFIFEVMAVYIYFKSKVEGRIIFISLSISGLVFYIFLIIKEMPYGYRMLETASSFQPLSLALIYSKNPASRLRIKVYLVFIGLYSVRYWQSLLNSEGIIT